MANRAHVWIGIALLFGTAAMPHAQDGVVTLRKRPILTVDKLFSATHQGTRRQSGREVSQIVVSFQPSDLSGVTLANVAVADSWWLWKGEQDSNGVIHPVFHALPHHPIRASAGKNNHITLEMNPDRLGLHRGDRLLLFLEAYRIRSEEH